MRKWFLVPLLTVTLLAIFAPTDALASIRTTFNVSTLQGHAAPSTIEYYQDGLGDWQNLAWSTYYPQFNIVETVNDPYAVDDSTSLFFRFDGEKVFEFAPTGSTGDTFSGKFQWDGVDQTGLVFAGGPHVDFGISSYASTSDPLVPEPGTAALCLLGLSMFCPWRRVR